MTLRYEALGLRFLVLSAQIHHRAGKIQNLGKMPRFFAEDAIQPLHPGTFLAAHGSGGEHNDVDMPEVWFLPDGHEHVQAVVFRKVHVEQNDAGPRFRNVRVTVYQKSQGPGTVGKRDEFVGFVRLRAIRRRSASRGLSPTATTQGLLMGSSSAARWVAATSTLRFPFDGSTNLSR